jgi:hypothetical protein
MYLPEDILGKLFPAGGAAELRFIRSLAPVQHDCPPQWLRDRLLRLADGVDTGYSGTCSSDRDTSLELRRTLELAGLNAGGEASDSSRHGIVLSADAVGKRMSEDEMGYWKEEAHLNERCGAAMEGDKLASCPGYLPTFPGMESML